MPVFNNALAGAAGSAGGAAAYEIERSLRFDSTASAHLDRAVNSSANRKRYTISFWIKRTTTGSQQRIYTTNANSYLMFNSSDYLHGNTRGTSGSNNFWYTYQKFTDPAAWYHIVAVYDLGVSTPGLEIYVNGIKVSIYGNVGNYDQHSGGTHTIGGISYFLDGYLAEYHHLDGIKINGTTDTDGSVTGTPGAVYMPEFGEFDDNGVWQPKEYTGSHGTHGFYLDFKDTSSNAALGYDAAGSNNWTVTNMSASATATGTVSGTGTPANASGSGGWKQAFDGSTSTLVYNSNGSTTTTFTLDTPIAWTNSIRIYAGQNGTSGTNIIANGVNLSSSVTWALSGDWQNVTSQLTSPLTSLALTSVGGSSSNIRAVEIDGTVIVQSDAASIDSFIESPTNYEASSGNNGGNYATLNPLNKGSHMTLRNGNLEVTSGSHSTSLATQAVSAGMKSYMEFSIENRGILGWGVTTDPLAESGYSTQADKWWVYDNQNHNFSINNGTTSTGYGVRVTATDVLQLAIDYDAGKVFIGINNTWINSTNGTNGNPSTGANPTFTFSTNNKDLFPFFHVHSGTYHCNFGARPFAYTPPTDFKSLCTQNIPDKVVGTQVFDAKTYDGNGGTQAINNFKFSPDLGWFKRRDTTGRHTLVDTLRTRAKGSYVGLTTNSSSPAEFTSDANKDVVSFDSDGFTLGPNNQTGVNENNAELVAWAWDAGDAANATSVSAGSLSSSSYTYGTYSGKWNSTFSPSSTGSVADGERAFNGDLGNYASMQNSNSFSKWQPNSPIQINSSLRVLASGINSGNNQVAVNGTYFYVTNKPVWYTITASYLTEIRLQDTGSTHGRLWAVEVDGKILVDNSITPPSLPSIATSYRVNNEAGFSIVSYQGDGNTATVATGLSGDPGMIFIKDRDTSTDWPVYHKGFDDPQANVNILNNLSTVQSIGGYWTGTRSNLIGLKSGTWAHNTSGKNYIAYCWAQREGFSRFDEYRGDGQPNGPFIYTGFRPRWILIKHTGGQDWVLFDTARDIDNDNDIEKITVNETNGEVTHSNWIDIYSNGFKLKTNSAAINENGTKYIYSAFAEHPLKLARAR